MRLLFVLLAVVFVSPAYAGEYPLVQLGENPNVLVVPNGSVPAEARAAVQKFAKEFPAASKRRGENRVIGVWVIGVTNLLDRDRMELLGKTVPAVVAKDCKFECSSNRALIVVSHELFVPEEFRPKKGFPFCTFIRDRAGEYIMPPHNRVCLEWEYISSEPHLNVSYSFGEIWPEGQGHLFY